MNINGTWLWNTELITLKADTIISGLVQLNCNTLFLQINKNKMMSVYNDFLIKAHANGIKVYALGGDACWIDSVSSVDGFFNYISIYHSNSSFEKFDGINLDIEPYLHKSWTLDYENTVELFQRTIIMCNQKAKDLNLPISYCIPFWYDDKNYNNKAYGRGNLLEWTLANTNLVVVMAYRDTAPNILKVIDRELQLAPTFKCIMHVAVETLNISPNYITFAGKDLEYFHKQLSDVDTKCKTNIYYGGLCIHDLINWFNKEKINI